MINQNEVLHTEYRVERLETTLVWSFGQQGTLDTWVCLHDRLATFDQAEKLAAAEPGNVRVATVEYGYVPSWCAT